MTAASHLLETSLRLLAVMNRCRLFWGNPGPKLDHGMAETPHLEALV